MQDAENVQPTNLEADAISDSVDDLLSLRGNEFQAAFGEKVDEALDIERWREGEDLGAMYESLERQVVEAVEQEGHIRERVRAELFPYVFNAPFAPQAPAKAGCYQVDGKTLESIHRGLLFNGGVEACDGTSLVHDTVPMTIAQIGVSLVSYQGSQGSWVHRLFRRDMRVSGVDPVAEAIALIEQRKLRGSTDAQSPRDYLSDFTQRGIMAYAERAILLHKSNALWRMGHGHPVPYELLTGGGLVIDHDMPLLRRSMEMWEALLEQHQRWVFVTSAPADRVLLTLGDALYPLEYALAGTPLQSMRDIADGHLPDGLFSGRKTGLKTDTRAFVERIGPQIVTGLYRASIHAPVRLFYAHKNYAHMAALIAMADSVLQEHRGFPMLIDLADLTCHTTFGSDTFRNMIQQAYTEAGTPFRYLGERETRR